ncbi:DUF559 domain-containing protein [Microbacterium sp.]|uniref:DUF559 domain-containing protein n=1 Tax=Microbacterium sp. TaxID=51671 RepID=UPI003735F576
MDEQALCREIRRLGGVARTSTLVAAGASRHRVETSVARGLVMKVRRGWIAVPDADAELIAAARAGVVITCVSAAVRHGLWVMRDARPHVAAPTHAGRIHRADAIVHWASPTVPRHPDVLIDSVENSLIAVARCQPHDLALAVWESALRKGKVTRDSMRMLTMPPAARSLCESASLYSDSGLETLLPRRLRWLGLPLRQQVWLIDRPVDLLIADRLVVQVDGAHHVGAQRAADIAHDARLMLHGYHVIRVTYGQVVDSWPVVQDLITGAIARGLHLAR